MASNPIVGKRYLWGDKVVICCGPVMKTDDTIMKSHPQCENGIASTGVRGFVNVKELSEIRVSDE